jgi:putative hydrolase of the HAD superfamily
LTHPARVCFFQARTLEADVIEAIIFDFGGVFTSSPFEAFARYEQERGLPTDILRKINSTNHEHNAWALFERAELDLDGFDKAFAAEAKALGHDIPGRDIIPLLAGHFRPEMIEALRRLKVKFKTGCITNNVPSMQASGAGGRGNLYKTEIMELFDHVIESSKTGIRKPDPRIYQMMCETLKVDAKACVYLDDLGINLKPPRTMGMHTIKVESGPQAVAALEHATGMNLRAA